MIYETIYKKLEKLGVIDLVKSNIEGVKAQSSGFMDLNFDRLFHKEGDGYKVIALSHYFKQNGDSMADPDMEIRIYLEHEMAEALTFQQDNLGIFQVVYPNPDTYNPKAKKELNKFLNQWLSNLIKQGFSFKEVGK